MAHRFLVQCNKDYIYSTIQLRTFDDFCVCLADWNKYEIMALYRPILNDYSWIDTLAIFEDLTYKSDYLTIVIMKDMEHQDSYFIHFNPYLDHSIELIKII